MVRGVLKGKFALTEDQLTSTVLGYLELLPASALLRFIAMAQPASALATSLSFSPNAGYEVHGWPRTEKHGEPDLLLLVRDGNDEHAIIVEAKYGASKSQWEAAASAAEEPERARYDQLVRYWLALTEADFAAQIKPRVSNATTHAVVYLTHDASPPIAELNNSIDLAPSIRLSWLSWHHLAEALQTVSPTSPSEKLVIAALAELLAFLGFRTFIGFGAADLREPITEALWTLHNGLYDIASTPVVTATPVWRFGGGT